MGKLLFDKLTTLLCRRTCHRHQPAASMRFSLDLLNGKLDSRVEFTKIPWGEVFLKTKTCLSTEEKWRRWWHCDPCAEKQLLRYRGISLPRKAVHSPPFWWLLEAPFTLSLSLSFHAAPPNGLHLVLSPYLYTLDHLLSWISSASFLSIHVRFDSNSG